VTLTPLLRPPLRHHRAMPTFLDRLLKFLSTVDGHDKTLKAIQYGAKLCILSGKLTFKPTAMPILFIRLQHLYRILQSSRFVTRLGYWLNSYSRLLWHIRSGAIFKLSADPRERLFEILDMLETVIQLLEGWLQDLVILSMYHALDPEINRRWRGTMNILWLTCLLISGVLMLRNYLNALGVVKLAEERRRRGEIREEEQQQKEGNMQQRSSKRQPADSVEVHNHDDDAGNQEDKAVSMTTTRRGRRAKPLTIDTKLASIYDDDDNCNRSEEQSRRRISPMSARVSIRMHTQERRLGVIHPDYGTHISEGAIVASRFTTARGILRHLPNISLQLVKYLGDLVYCSCDTLQVFGRNTNPVQWAKASAALTAAICAILLRWEKMFLPEASLEMTKRR